LVDDDDDDDIIDQVTSAGTYPENILGEDLGSFPLNLCVT